MFTIRRAWQKLDGLRRMISPLQRIYSLCSIINFIMILVRAKIKSWWQELENAGDFFFQNCRKSFMCLDGHLGPGHPWQRPVASFCFAAVVQLFKSSPPRGGCCRPAIHIFIFQNFFSDLTGDKKNISKARWNENDPHSESVASVAGLLTRFVIVDQSRSW
jgi:hypothetical protein